MSGTPVFQGTWFIDGIYSQGMHPAAAQIVPAPPVKVSPWSYPVCLAQTYESSNNEYGESPLPFQFTPEVLFAFTQNAGESTIYIQINTGEYLAWDSSVSLGEGESLGLFILVSGQENATAFTLLDFDGSDMASLQTSRLGFNGGTTENPETWYVGQISFYFNFPYLPLSGVSSDTWALTFHFVCITPPLPDILEHKGTEGLYPISDPGISSSPLPFDGPVFEGVDLSGADFQGCTMTNADFSNCNLTGTIFTNCNLTGAIFTGATFSNTDFSGATLTGATFVGADLTDIVASTVPTFCTGSPGPSSPITYFTGCTMNFDFLGYDWSLLDLSGSTINSIPSTLSDSQSNPGFHAYRTTFPVGLDLSGCTMTGAVLNSAIMTGVVFSDGIETFADLSYAQMDDATLSDADLGGVNLSGANLNMATLTPESRATTNLVNANLSGAILTSAKLTNVSLNGAQLYGANLGSGSSVVVLDGTVFTGANLSGASFSGTITNVNFDQTQMVACIFDGATFSGAVSFVGAFLQGASFSGATVAGANFEGAIFSVNKGSATVPTGNHSNPTYAVLIKGATVPDSESSGFDGCILPDNTQGPLAPYDPASAHVIGTFMFTDDSKNGLLAALPVPPENVDTAAHVTDGVRKWFNQQSPSVTLGSLATIRYFGSGQQTSSGNPAPTDTWVIFDSNNHKTYSILNPTATENDPLSVYLLPYVSP